MNCKVDRNSAVILCSHVADGSFPILAAIRNEPDDESDSGWQVLCNAHEENWKDAKIWSVSEVLQYEPSLEVYIDTPSDITIVREGTSSSWKETE